VPAVGAMAGEVLATIGEMRLINALIRQNESALHDITQFPHVPWPGIGFQGRQNVGIELLVGTVPAIQFGQKAMRQTGDIPGALAQWRHPNGKNHQTKIEILAEPALCNGLLGIAIGGGNQSHIHRDFRISTDPHDRAGFQDAQQLHLQIRGHFSEFVEKQSAARSALEVTPVLAGRARETALFMTEQLGPDQLRGNRATVDREITPIAAGTQFDGSLERSNPYRYRSRLGATPSRRWGPP
jgi:hypothetical protein